MRRLIAMGRLAASIGAIALVTVLYAAFLRVNPTTVALSYLAVILIIATSWHIADATAAALAAALALNFFFLPPVGTFTIVDPQNWVALVAFLVAAILTSQLSGRARRRHLEAARRLLPGFDDQRYVYLNGDVGRPPRVKLCADGVDPDVLVWAR